MARKDLIPENKKASYTDFPKLKLVNGETARIIMLEAPWSEFTHELRAPQILNGEVQMEMAKTKGGEEYETHKMDFIGKYICLGDPGVLADLGSDAKHCPMCAAAAGGKEVGRAVERYASNVVRYKADNTGRKLQDPFAVEVLVWGYTQTRWDTLYGLAEDLAEGDELRKHDLFFGPCQNAMFQKFDITPSLKPGEWMANKERQKTVLDTYQNNKASDEILANACGRKVDAAFAEQGIAQIRERWAMVNGITNKAEAPTREVSATSAASLNDGLDSLLGDGGSSSSELNDLLSTPADDISDIVIDKPNSSGEKVSFDDLLNEFSSTDEPAF